MKNILICSAIVLSLFSCATKKEAKKELEDLEKDLE
jgi:hypothetical protein